jgi:hypothetical protein
MKMKWMTLAALVVAITPTLALAQPTPGVRVRPNLYHDRSPHMHMHESVAHH